jgi:hypothetical protein
VTGVRTCVGCGRPDAQRVMVRLAVRDGVVVVDRARRVAGRGAYLHERGACLRAFATRRGLVRSLRASVPREVREAVTSHLASVASEGEE